MKYLYIIIALAFQSIAFSKNYYVSTTGNDSNNGTSTSTPWASMSGHWSLINAGDSVLFKCGNTWTNTGVSITSKSGNSSAYIIMGAYGSGNKPIISRNSSNGDVLDLTDCNYFVVQDIEFHGNIIIEPIDKNTNYGNIKLLRLTIDGQKSGDVTGGGLYFHNYLTESTPENWSGAAAHDMEIGYCVFKNCGNQGDAFNCTMLYNLWIHHNYFYNSFGGEAIDVGGGDNVTIEYNIISGTHYNGIKLHCQMHTVDNAVIRYNLVMYGGTDPCWGIEFLNGRNGQVYNNTWYNLGANQMTCYFGFEASNPPLLTGQGTWGFSGNQIFNNIFYGPVSIGTANNIKIRYKNGTRITLNQSATYVQDNNSFYNNVYYHPTSNDLIEREYWDSDPGIDSIYWNGSAYALATEMNSVTVATKSNFSTAWKETNEKYVNPNLVAPSWTSALVYGDFHLNSGSPCIGAGASVPSNLVDLDGNAVPSNTPDIGAFQKQIIISKTLSLNSPNGGENLNIGAIQNISWASSGINNITITYSTNNGSNWLSVASNIPASSTSYSWTVPNTPSTVCKVKLVCVEDPSLTDISSNTFTINASYVIVNSKAFLQSSFNNGTMNTTLRDNGILPLSQPYNVTPWNYSGTESVTSIPNAVVDWILIELRSDTSASSSIGKRAAFIKNDGSIVDLDGTSIVRFNNLNNGSYYLIIKHRNHLAIMSANLIAFTTTTSLYDFTTAQNKAFGTNSMNQLATNVYGLCSGDANKDGSVSVLDYSEVGKSIFNEGYLREDLDMNGVVNVLDYQKIYTSILKYSHVSN